MEKVQSCSKMKLTKVKALNEYLSPIKNEVDEPLLIGRGRHQRSMSPSSQAYAENLDVGSPLVRYFRAGSPISGKVASPGEVFSSPTFGSSKYKSMIVQQYSSNSSGNSGFGSRGRLSVSPLSSVENLELPLPMSQPLYGTPVKVDEEVIVMDDILVTRTPGGKSGKFLSASSGGPSSSPSSSGKSLFNTEICRAWEEFGTCRYSSKCQFAHGKEELRPSHPSIKSKSSEAQASKSSTSSGSCTNGNRSRTHYQPQAEAGSEDLLATSQRALLIKPEPSLANPNAFSVWSPLDDCIQIVPPRGAPDKAPSREEVDAHINSILYGPRTKRRLPVFAEICSDDH